MRNKEVLRLERGQSIEYYTKKILVDKIWKSLLETSSGAVFISQWVNSRISCGCAIFWKKIMKNPQELKPHFCLFYENYYEQQ